MTYEEGFGKCFDHLTTRYEKLGHALEVSGRGIRKKGKPANVSRQVQSV